MGRRKKKGRFGHYCWACQSHLPNEKFSGKGHGKHICRGCAKLGPEELVFRQAFFDMQRCITWEGCIRRKQRVTFERFLRHEDARVREMAETFAQTDAQYRELSRAGWQAEDITALAEEDIWFVDDGFPF